MVAQSGKAQHGCAAPSRCRLQPTASRECESPEADSSAATGTEDCQLKSRGGRRSSRGSFRSWGSSSSEVSMKVPLLLRLTIRINHWSASLHRWATLQEIAMSASAHSIFSVKAVRASVKMLDTTAPLSTDEINEHVARAIYIAWSRNADLKSVTWALACAINGDVERLRRYGC